MRYLPHSESERTEMLAIIGAAGEDDLFSAVPRRAFNREPLDLPAHTGDVEASVAEVRRVLRPGGTAVVMIYAKHSFRRYSLIAMKLPELRDGGRAGVESEVRRVYDQTVAGEAAPVIEFLSRADARRAFEPFGQVTIRRENFDPIKAIPRERLLGLPARLMGVDLYITAVA
jgi:hypothetical protein